MTLVTPGSAELGAKRQKFGTEPRTAPSAQPLILENSLSHCIEAGLPTLVWARAVKQAV